MDTGDIRTDGIFSRLDLLSSVRDGERHVCMLRLVFMPVFLAFSFVYNWRSPGPPSALFPTANLAATATILLSLTMLVLIRRGRFRQWMAYVSAISDVLLAGAVIFSSAMSYPLHFATSMVPSILFIVVALAAVRRIPMLAVIVGVLAAVMHLVSSGHFYGRHVPEGGLYVADGGAPLFGLNFLDDVSKAVCLVAMAWLIAYVTKTLRDSRRRYQDLFDHIPDGIVITSASDRVVTVNARFASMLGADAGSIIGLRAADLLRQPEGPQIDRAEPAEGLIGRPAVMRRRDGTEIPIRAASSPMTLDEGVYSILSVRDVSDQIQIEKQLSRSQEMEAFGRMAGGLAHDINNILGGILGAASLTRRLASRLEPAEAERLDRNMAIVAECGEKAREVIGKLLAFSRGANIEPRLLDLNEILADVSSICRNTFGPEYRISVTGTDGPAMVLADGQALAQALLNLCINARDAMAGGGDIDLSLDSCLPDVNLLAMNPGARRRAEYWRLTTRDNGPGITARNMGSIFDPFFTTKPPEKGSGLGLAMVHSIAIRHLGFVDVESSPGKGAVFRIYLPKAGEETREKTSRTSGEGRSS